MKKIILYVLVIIMMIIIFFFSNQPATSSGKQSGKVVNIIVNIIEKVANQNFTNEKREELCEKISFPIRKGAHFTLYFILGLLVFSLLKQYNINTKEIIIMSILICILYACTDEIHQLFVKGRSGEIVDVCIDTLGSLFSILLCTLLSKKDKKL